MERAAVAEAITLHQQGNLEEAGAAYLSILESNPDDADVLNYLGMLEFQRGNTNRGIELAESCLAIDPDHVAGCNNIANMYLTTYRVKEAEEHYLKAIHLDSQAIEPLFNMGVIEKSRKNYSMAEDYFNRVLSFNPEHTVCLSALANMYTRLGHFEPALYLLKTNLGFEMSQQDQKSTLLAIGRLCLLLDNQEDAMETYTKWLTLYPGDPTATHMLAAITGENIPEKPDERYVKDLFDSFAATFDNVLDNLEYQAPQHIQTICESLFQQSDPGSLTILDAGCGTGLCGYFLKPLSSRLTGVDLSSGMLQRAKLRDLYDELIEQDLNSYLRQSINQFDLIVSADTLCYFGNLGEFLQLSQTAMKPGGFLIYTVERHDGTTDTGYHLESHGRYSHTYTYLSEVMKASGYHVDAIHERNLRLERNKPVNGFLVIARRT
ncbi:MAG: tetratricopeptide repeat protein [Granulosicoccus sp.]|nr:tetratricopeptide repeat protein [Granulosicoccus sp.]